MHFSLIRRLQKGHKSMINVSHIIIITTSSSLSCRLKESMFYCVLLQLPNGLHDDEYCCKHLNDSSSHWVKRKENSCFYVVFVFSSVQNVKVRKRLRWKGNHIVKHKTSSSFPFWDRCLILDPTGLSAFSISCWLKSQFSQDSLLSSSFLKLLIIWQQAFVGCVLFC